MVGERKEEKVWDESEASSWGAWTMRLPQRHQDEGSTLGRRSNISLQGLSSTDEVEAKSRLLHQFNENLLRTALYKTC